MSRVVSLHHIVINTKSRKKTIPSEYCDEMYRFITSIIKRNSCVLYRIGGIENHIHMLVDLSPTVSLSHLMWDIKRASSNWAKSNPHFPDFEGWGKEYGAFSASASHKEAIINYIMNQRTHHAHTSFEAEYEHLYIKNGVERNHTHLT